MNVIFWTPYPQTPPEWRVIGTKFDSTCWLPEEETAWQGDLEL